MRFSLSLRISLVPAQSAIMATIVSEHTRITPALFDVYRKAKKATSTAIKWVVSTSAIGGHNPEPNAAWSLDDLTRAANIIRARCIETPQTIACAFEVAIGARAEITAYFKQHLEDDHEATSSHEHFTDTLRLIFDDLRPSRRHIPKTTSSSTPQHPHSIVSPNPFQLLTSVHETEPESVDWRAYDESSSKANSQGPFSTQESAGETFCLKDDDLATHFEMYYVLTVILTVSLFRLSYADSFFRI